MDITNLLLELGDINSKRFEDVLYKNINMDFYYVLNFYKKRGNWEYEVLKIEGSREDIVRRIKLFDQSSSSVVGVSFGVGTFINKKRFTKVMKNAEEWNKGFVEVGEVRERGEMIFPENEKSMKEMWRNVRGLRGYMTLAVEGSYLVDMPGYGDKVIEELYLGMRKGIEEVDFCYLCGGEDELIHGGYKEPAWKLLSTTRTNDLSEDKKAFVRCMGCEKRIMLGSDLIKGLTRSVNRSAKVYEEIIIPLTKNKMVWDQLIELRIETDSDLKFYEALVGKIDRWGMRGVNRFLQMRVLRNQRNYTVLNVHEVGIEEVKRLKEKRGFVNWLWDVGFYKEGKGLLYYPEKLLDKEEDRKWYYIEQVKRYWLGVERESNLWRNIEKFIGYGEGELAIYDLWKEYYVKGEEGLMEDILKSRNYILGVLMGIARGVQEKEYKKYRLSGEVSLKRRFREYPKDEIRAFEEVLKVLDINSTFLNKNEKKQVKDWTKRYLASEAAGESRYYYLGLMGVS